MWNRWKGWRDCQVQVLQDLHWMLILDVTTSFRWNSFYVYKCLNLLRTIPLTTIERVRYSGRPIVWIKPISDMQFFAFLYGHLIWKMPNNWVSTLTLLWLLNHEISNIQKKERGIRVHHAHHWYYIHKYFKSTGK